MNSDDFTISRYFSFLVKWEIRSYFWRIVENLKIAARDFAIMRLAIQKLEFQKGEAIIYDRFFSLRSFESQLSPYSGFHIFSDWSVQGVSTCPSRRWGWQLWRIFFIHVTCLRGRKKHILPIEDRTEGTRTYVPRSCETFNFKIPSGHPLYTRPFFHLHCGISVENFHELTNQIWQSNERSGA